LLTWTALPSIESATNTGLEEANKSNLVKATECLLHRLLKPLASAKGYFTTQIIAHSGKVLGIYRKQTIAEDEVNWFAPGSGTTVFHHPKVVFGLSICADIGTPELFSKQASLGAQIVFEAAAPGLYGSQTTRDWLSGYQWWQNECHSKLGRYALDNSIYIAVATQAGRTIDEDFPEGGYVFGPDGTCLSTTSDWSEGVLYITLPAD
jgi:predicted amidohydrolase